MRSLYLIPALLILIFLFPRPAQAEEHGSIAEDLLTKIQTKVDDLFTRADTRQTRAVLIQQDGKILIERYAPGFNEKTRFLSWSMAKSITATAAGILVAEGKLDLDAPLDIPQWRQDERSRITLRHMLNMTAGLKHSEESESLWDAAETDTARALFSTESKDAVAYALNRAYSKPAGETFQYSTIVSILLAWLVSEEITSEYEPEKRRKAILEWYQSRIFQPTGINSAVMEFDAQGNFMGGSFVHMTARDWIRMGQIYAQDGQIDGMQIVPKSWVDYVKTPITLNPQYGAQFWINSPYMEGQLEAMPHPYGPETLYGMLGHLGQFVLIAPERGLVIVRLGKTPDQKLRPIRKILGQIADLFPPVSKPPASKAGIKN